MAFERETERLRLRRPVRDDLPGFVALHGDPEDECRRRLASYVLDWEELDFGYLAVEELGSGRLVGWGGVRLTAEPRTLNLYYRLDPSLHGQGLGRELVAALLAGVRDELPDHTVRATVRRSNAAALATARSAGLVEVGEQSQPGDAPDEPPSVVLVLRPSR